MRRLILPASAAIVVLACALPAALAAGGKSGGGAFTNFSLAETTDDREWIAADGSFGYCFSYHDAQQGITVGCGKTVGSTGVTGTTQYASALDADHAFQTSENGIGNLVIDPASHVIYQTYSAI